MSIIQIPHTILTIIQQLSLCCPYILTHLKILGPILEATPPSFIIVDKCLIQKIVASRTSPNKWMRATAQTHDLKRRITIVALNKAKSPGEKRGVVE